MLQSIGLLLLLQGNRQKIWWIRCYQLYRNHKTAKGNGGTTNREVFFYELSKLIETENKLLASAPSVLEKRAGIQSFEKFKYINTVNSLAGGDLTKWDDILGMPYERVLTKLLLNKTEAEYQKRYSEIMQNV